MKLTLLHIGYYLTGIESANLLRVNITYVAKTLNHILQ